VSSDAADLFSLRGNRCLIVGGTAGIGLGVAEHFVSAGARVVIAGRRESGREIALNLGAGFVGLDLTQADSIAASIADAAGQLDGAIDTLILNAGVTGEAGVVEHLDMSIFRRVFEVNVFGIAQAMRDGLAYMTRGGSVIVTSSPAATELLPEISAYAASKAAINVIVRTAALELGQRDIRVNAVLPGVVETEMALDTNALQQELEMLSTFTVNGEIRHPADMVGPFHFLASRAGKTCTGALLSCDDGATCGFSPLLLERAFG
jgi:NAD(P)-dependent dehydrogenase (short-subunit alcohol dehydrogenase family)